MDLVNLDALCSDLTVAAKRLKALCDTYGTINSANGDNIKDLINTAGTNGNNKNDEIAVARGDLCGIASRLQILLASPTCFIRRIATQASQLSKIKGRENS